MSKRLLLIWTGLFVLICLIGVSIYMSNNVKNVATPIEADSSQKQFNAVPQVPGESKIAAPVSTPKAPTASEAAVKQPKPLNLNLDSTPETVSSPSTIEGPVKPSTTSENTPAAGEGTLPLKGTSQKDKLLYGYEGKDKDDNVNLMLGVQKGDVTVKSGVKKGEDETDVQSIDIEIKLPK